MKGYSGMKNETQLQDMKLQKRKKRAKILYILNEKTGEYFSRFFCVLQFMEFYKLDLNSFAFYNVIP